MQKSMSGALQGSGLLFVCSRVLSLCSLGANYESSTALRVQSLSKSLTRLHLSSPLEDGPCSPVEGYIPGQ